MKTKRINCPVCGSTKYKHNLDTGDQKCLNCGYIHSDSRKPETFGDSFNTCGGNSTGRIS